MVWLNPATDYRYSLKKGMLGTDVAALQINFEDLIVDADFGEATEAEVIDFQQKHGLEDDGVAGPVTQRKLIVQRSQEATKIYDLPAGLLKSIVANESNFNVAAVSHHPSDGGLDVGAYQRSSGKQIGTQAFYQDAYNIRSAALKSAADIKEVFENLSDPVPSRYLDDMAGGNKEKFKWQLAILSHNWPYAAENIPKYGVIYKFDLGQDEEPQQWIIDASAGRLETPRQWVYSYVERSTVYIKWR